MTLDNPWNKNASKWTAYSLISYLRQVMPQASAALLIACTIATLRDSLSRNTKSKDILPISDLQQKAHQIKIFCQFQICNKKHIRCSYVQCHNNSGAKDVAATKRLKCNTR